MDENSIVGYLKKVLENAPKEWLSLTTHRLDIYEEKLAKTQFLEQFENLYQNNNAKVDALYKLPTAYDYIRLGHPLSCVLEWTIAKLNNLKPESVISFSSKTTPILAVLRKNLLQHKNTQILFSGNLPENFDADILRKVYGYKFELKPIEKSSEISAFDGSTILVSNQDKVGQIEANSNVDFIINLHEDLGIFQLKK